jgi:hypothetical protein
MKEEKSTELTDNTQRQIHQSSTVLHRIRTPKPKDSCIWRNIGRKSFQEMKEYKAIEVMSTIRMYGAQTRNLRARFE